MDLPPLVGVKLSSKNDIAFYENGKLKEVYMPEGKTFETPIGTLTNSNSRYTRKAFLHIEYYESGSPKAMYATADITMSINDVKYGCRGCYSTSMRFD